METEETLRKQIAEFLVEIDAEVYERQGSESTSVSLTGDAELWRVWPELSPDLIPQAIDFLNEYTSVDNYLKNQPRKYVVNPKVGREEWEGVWRQAYVRRVVQGDVTKLVQVLRKGYAQSINWDEARLGGGINLRDQPTGSNTSYEEKYVEIIWPNCSPYKLHEMAASLNASSYSDKSVCGYTFSGAWSNLTVGSKVETDGSGTIVLTMARPRFRLDGFINTLTHRIEDVIYLWGWEKDKAQAVADAWGNTKGRSCRFQVDKKSGLVDIILSERDFVEETITGVLTGRDCRYSEVADYHFGVEDPDLYPLETTPEQGKGITYTRQLRDNGDGSWDIIITTRTVQYRDIDEYVSQRSAGESVSTHQQLGVTTQTVDSIDAAEDGVIASRDVQIRDDCSKDVVTRKETGKALESVSVEISPASTRTVTEKTVQTAELTTPSSEEGKIKRVVNRDSKYPSRYDTIYDEEIPNNQTAAGAAVDGFSKSAVTLETEKGSVAAQAEVTALAASTASGAVTEIDAQPTRSGRWRFVKRIVTAINNAFSFASNEAHDASEATEVETQAASKEDAALVDGAVVIVDSEPTRFGKWFNRKRTITAKNQTASFQQADDADKTTVLSVETQGSEVQDATYVEGTVERAENTPTRFGRYSIAKLVTTFKARVMEWVSASDASQTTESTVNTEQDAVAEATPESGKIVRVQNSLKPSGKYDQRIDKTTPINQTASYSGEKSLAREMDVEKATSADSMVEADNPLTAGAIVEADNTPTDAGKWATIKRKIRLLNQQAFGYDRGHFADVDTELNTAASAAVSDPGASALGQLVSVDNKPLPTGQYQTTLSTEEAKKVQTSYSFEDKEGTVSVWAGLNVTEDEYAAVIATAALTDATNNSVDKRPNRFGLFDYTIVKAEYADAAGGGGYGYFTAFVEKTWAWRQVKGYDKTRGANGQWFVIIFDHYEVWERSRDQAIAALAPGAKYPENARIDFHAFRNGWWLASWDIARTSGWQDTYEDT